MLVQALAKGQYLALEVLGGGALERWSLSYLRHLQPDHHEMRALVG
jgi:hypothetical protein